MTEDATESVFLVLGLVSGRGFGRAFALAFGAVFFGRFRPVLIFF